MNNRVFCDEHTGGCGASLTSTDYECGYCTQCEKEITTMALELDVTCSSHNHWKEPRRIKLVIDGPLDLIPESLKERIETHGWIVQFNGKHMDTYCSKKCAE